MIYLHPIFSHIFILQAHNKAKTAATEAQAAHDLAAEAKQRSVEELERSSSLSTQIEEFTNDEKASPESVQKLAQEVRQKSNVPEDFQYFLEFN